MKNYKPTNKTYQIETIGQLFEVITKENLPYIMADIYKTAELMLALDVINKSSSGRDYKKIELPVFEWLDDGKNELTQVTLSDGKTILDIKEMASNI